MKLTREDIEALQAEAKRLKDVAVWAMCVAALDRGEGSPQWLEVERFAEEAVK